MAKTVEVLINGTAYQMPASYKAAKELARTVGDPLKLTLIAHGSGGAPPMSIEDVVNIVAIGVRHAGCNLPTDTIGEAIVEAGVGDYLTVVFDYILAIVSGSGDPGPKA